MPFTQNTTWLRGVVMVSVASCSPAPSGVCFARADCPEQFECVAAHCRGPAHHLELVSALDSGVVGAALVSPVRVRVVDALGGGVPDTHLSFSMLDGGGHVVTGEGVSDDAGLVLQRLVLGPQQGVNVFRVSADLPGAYMELEVSATGAPPVTGPPGWRPRAPMPTARPNAGAALGEDGRIYVMGGGWSAGLRTTEVYDPATDTWDAGPSLPIANSTMAAIAGRDGGIFLFGGFQARSALFFSVATQTFTPLPALPTGRAFVRGALAPDGRLVVIGGDNLAGTADLPTVEIFNAATSTWRAGARLQKGRGNLAVVAGGDGRIYAFGGDNITTTGTTFDTSEAWDAVADRWVYLRAMPVPNSGIYADLGPDGRMYVMAGSRIDAYAPTRDVWEAVASPPNSHQLVVRAPDGRLFGMGGSAIVEAYGPEVTVSPSRVDAGGAVQVQGVNFAANARVSASLDDLTGPVVFEGMTDDAGTLVDPPTLSAQVGGRHSLYFVDDRSGFPVTVALEVEGELVDDPSPPQLGAYRVACGCGGEAVPFIAAGLVFAVRRRRQV